MSRFKVDLARETSSKELLASIWKFELGDLGLRWCTLLHPRLARRTAAQTSSLNATSTRAQTSKRAVLA